MTIHFTCKHLNIAFFVCLFLSVFDHISCFAHRRSKTPDRRKKSRSRSPRSRHRRLVDSLRLIITCLPSVLRAYVLIVHWPVNRPLLFTLTLSSQRPAIKVARTSPVTWSKPPIAISRSKVSLFYLSSTNNLILGCYHWLCNHTCSSGVPLKVLPFWNSPLTELVAESDIFVHAAVSIHSFICF